MFDAASVWARSRGLDRIIGPRGFSVFDGLGLLVRGFEHRPAFGLPYNLAYYPSLVEAAGFAPTEDIVSGYLAATTPFPERIHRLSELVQQRRGLRIVRFRNRRDLRAIIPWLKDLYNGALGTGGGGVPLNDQDVKGLADQMLWFADPRLVKIVMKDDVPVGFLFAYPDISAAVQRIGGRVFPLGWYHLWRELKRTRWINVNGAGIVEQDRGLGGTAILFSEMHKSVVEGGYLYADLVQIGLENDKMQRELGGSASTFIRPTGCTSACCEISPALSRRRARLVFDAKFATLKIYVCGIIVSIEPVLFQARCRRSVWRWTPTVCLA